MKLFKSTVLAAVMATTMLAGGAYAEDVSLMDGVTAREGDNPVVEAGKFKKDGPWVIGMSHFGVNANTWTVQVAHESEAAAASNACVQKFITRSTPDRLYQLRSKNTISPYVGKCRV